MATVICVADWAATGAMLQGFGTIGGALAVLFAAMIGSGTFKSWRLQKLSERRIEQAERILTATYKVRRGLSYVRNPAMWLHELEAAEEKLKDTGGWSQAGGDAQRQKKMIKAQAYYNRLSATRNDQRALEECQPMARALFGEKLENAIEELNHQFWTVQVYVDASHDDQGSDREFRRKIDAAIYEGYPSVEENEIDKSINKNIKIIEDTCVPVLSLKLYT